MKTILVVEDEFAIADMLSIVLEDEGYHVITAGNGKEGLACIEEAMPDLVLCDVMMPLLDGREMCRIMQAEPRFRSIPIILMSAVPNLIDDETDCSCVEFIGKPFDPAELLEIVVRHIGTPNDP